MRDFKNLEYKSSTLGTTEMWDITKWEWSWVDISRVIHCDLFETTSNPLPPFWWGFIGQNRWQRRCSIFTTLGTPGSVLQFDLKNVMVVSGSGNDPLSREYRENCISFRSHCFGNFHFGTRTISHFLPYESISDGFELFESLKRIISPKF